MIIDKVKYRVCT